MKTFTTSHDGNGGYEFCTHTYNSSHDTPTLIYYYGLVAFTFSTTEEACPDGKMVLLYG